MCLRFVRGEQTEEEMHEELKSLNNHGLKLLRTTLEDRDREVKQLDNLADKYARQIELMADGMSYEESLQALNNKEI